MTLGNAWAFPAASQEAGLGAMTALAAELRAQTAACDEQRSSDRPLPRARAGISARGRGAVARTQPGDPDSQAVHAGGGQRV